jgi:hypothetical protein
MVRAISQLETPFLQFVSIQKAVIHLSSPMGLSSKIVPTLRMNCFLQRLQYQIFRGLMKECFSPPHRGQVIIPFGQRRLRAYWKARSDRRSKQSLVPGGEGVLPGNVAGQRMDDVTHATKTKKPSPKRGLFVQLDSN